jgi:hypothetical protein
VIGVARPDRAFVQCLGSVVVIVIVTGGSVTVCVVVTVLVTV